MQSSGEYNLKRAAAKIFEMGPQTLVIKRGEYGAILFRPDGHFIVPGYLLEEVFDPTGAGDCFAGGFIGYRRFCLRKGFDSEKVTHRRQRAQPRRDLRLSTWQLLLREVRRGPVSHIGTPGNQRPFQRLP